MIVIIDYNMGNIGSIFNMLKKIGVTACISSNISTIAKADKIILPGVGAFDKGIESINQLGLLPTLNQKALVQKVPILGICLGMQLFTNMSEEGIKPGLGWIPGKTIRFTFNSIEPKLKIPHMGWNTVDFHNDSTIFKGLSENSSKFYFVHSYHLVCESDSDILATTNYGIDFTSAVQHENIIGTQFHPEKSHNYGMRLLQNFVEL